MKKEKKGKRKWKVGRIFIFLVFLVALYFGLSFYLKLPIENILIQGTKYLSDEKVMELAKIEEYPSFYWTSSGGMRRRLLASPLVKEVKIKKQFYHVVEITIEEYRVLYQKKVDGKIVLENKQEFLPEQAVLGVPVLQNYVPDTKYDAFLEGLNKMKEDILRKISEIEYLPNEFDKDRFLLSMDDGNSVYLTLTKFDRINYYDDILPQLGGKKGVLYLDSGNHFQIME